MEGLEAVRWVPGSRWTWAPAATGRLTSRGGRRGFVSETEGKTNPGLPISRLIDKHLEAEAHVPHPWDQSLGLAREAIRGLLAPEHGPLTRHLSHSTTMSCTPARQVQEPRTAEWLPAPHRGGRICSHAQLSWAKHL